MRILKFHTILLFSLISIYGFTQHSTEKIKSIQDSMRLELSDTVKSKWVKPELHSMIQLLNTPDSLFPYLPYDSVLYFRYGTNDNFEPAHWNKINSEHVIDSKILPIEKVTKILTVINNPLNFKWGECGTPLIEGAIVFYNSGIEIARIEHACSGGQIFTEPDNALIRWGILNEQGYKDLYKILK
ncbi:MAG: hypothetical protein MK105_19180 [Crocinitomicaceae bacterium]|nr:hypothetical protein [Crocinitomicaceae bacterium]